MVTILQWMPAGPSPNNAIGNLMNVTFACSSCNKATRQQCDAGQRELSCRHCGQAQPLRTSAFAAAGEPQEGLSSCLVCSSNELFIRKNFSQRLGMLIIVTGLVASSITWYFYLAYWSYGILLASALIDLVLYHMVGNLLQCYRCHSEYRGSLVSSDQEGFDLVIHERHRQQEARLKQAPSVEHGGN
tara:strand:+ start:910 stop:1470 length:561 start_codon:yes stop_codon:yes gene_type:complete